MEGELVMKQAMIEVPDMHCGGCQDRIEKAVGRLEGVRRVSASFQSGQVEVAYDEAAVDEQAIRSLIEQAGFEVR